MQGDPPFRQFIAIFVIHAVNPRKVVAFGFRRGSVGKRLLDVQIIILTQEMDIVFGKLAGIIEAVVGQQTGSLDITGQAHLLANLLKTAGITPNTHFIKQTTGLLGRPHTVAANDQASEGGGVRKSRTGRQFCGNHRQAVNHEANRASLAI